MLPSVSKLSAPRLAGRGGGEESALRDSSSCGVSRITEILTYAGPTDQARSKQRTQESQRHVPGYPRRRESDLLPKERGWMRFCLEREFTEGEKKLFL